MYVYISLMYVLMYIKLAFMYTKVYIYTIKFNEGFDNPHSHEQARYVL